MQAEAQSAWARHMERGLEHVLLIVGDVTEKSWEDVKTFASKLAEEFVDKIGVSYLGYDVTSHSSMRAARDDEHNYLDIGLMMNNKIELFKSDINSSYYVTSYIVFHNDSLLASF